MRDAIRRYGRLMLVAAVSCLALCAQAEKTITKPWQTITEMTEPLVLDFNGGITFGKSVSLINTPDAKSAIRITENRKVTLIIPKNVTVTLNGGKASGKAGAGAGIEVPESAALYVLGEGTLVAQGGSPAEADDTAAAGNRGDNGGAGGVGGKCGEVCFAKAIDKKGQGRRGRKRGRQRRHSQ